jgi:hypothetical protein
VDYGCPQETFEWCHQQRAPQLDCVKVLDGTESFHLSRARNCGNRIAPSEILVTLDADCLLKNHAMIDRIVKPVLNGRHVGSIVSVIEANGRGYPTMSYMAYRRSDWLRVRGYDEAMVGWGYEDDDFYLRLKMLGSCPFLWAEYQDFEIMHHADAERCAFYLEKDLGRSRHMNQLQAARRSSVNPEGFAGFRYQYYRGDSGRTTFGRFPRTLS